MDDSRFLNAGETKIQSLEPVTELFVVDPHQVHDGGVKIPDMDGILGDVVAEIVGRAVRRARLDPAASHPDRVTPRVVIPSAFGAVPLPLPSNPAAKLTSPDDQRVVKQASLFEIQH